MRHRGEPLPGTAATHFPSLSILHDPKPNTYMFTEDLHLGVIPIGGRTIRNKEFAVHLKGDHGESERARQIVRTIGRYDQHGDEALISDAVGEMARFMAWHGRAVFEILTGKSKNHELRAFAPQRLFRFLGYYLQIIPPADRELWKKRFILIDSSKVWEVEMPRRFGGSAGFRRMLGQLERFEQMGPKFVLRDLEVGVPTPHYDFREYARRCEVYYRRITGAWGWNRRDFTSEHSTEFYTSYRTLKFRGAQAALREHILQELNGLLVRLGISCNIELLGLPSSSEIAQVIREMMEGRVSFTAALERTTVL